jgi:hypothetical protein
LKVSIERLEPFVVYIKPIFIQNPFSCYLTRNF